MKRDWDVIRVILLRLESSTTPKTYLNAHDIQEFPMQEVAYNMRLLEQAGCIEATFRDSSTGSGEIIAAMARSLTHKGHDLLDAMRNDSVWAKVKDSFQSKGIEMTVDLVIATSKRIIESLLT